MNKVLIIGRLPPPIGGVTMHVSRLIEHLPRNGFDRFTFCDFKTDKWVNIIRKIIRHRTIHLHASNPYFQLLFAMLCVLIRKRLLLTYHGNWERYRFAGNWAVRVSAFFCAVPIVQNDESFTKAKCCNPNALLISTFIPAARIIPLDPQCAQQLSDFRKRFEFLFCTNAWNLAFDKNAKETYGISQIINSMRNVNSGGLVISDPSGNYRPFIEKSFGSVPKNVLFIDGPHDFTNILRVSDAFIRNTTTDGVSLSIYEAHACNVVALASNSVSRARFCVVYEDIANINLIEELKRGRIRLQNECETEETNAVSKLIDLYQQYI
ncbi:glycosyltransferase [Dyadobacter chenhuakuii]|uniref:Glycosyltransferase n=1 Tax=Dyadobacter chenhuakuii TaxID=2909339 RepID=A0ABY4XIJ3_9BACT|nr:glycosyltransferase [Dyadobacter chenhuakuii]MCF2496202.1 glycosyltransferase [Dyadobacter chenhuakuii]USJ30265.1 glycosyltransferase [Dyadobacter chenhuakuii]